MLLYWAWHNKDTNQATKTHFKQGKVYRNFLSQNLSEKTSVSEKIKKPSWISKQEMVLLTLYILSVGLIGCCTCSQLPQKESSALSGKWGKKNGKIDNCSNLYVVVDDGWKVSLVWFTAHEIFNWIAITANCKMWTMTKKRGRNGKLN